MVVPMYDQEDVAEQYRVLPEVLVLVFFQPHGRNLARATETCSGALHHIGTSDYSRRCGSEQWFAAARARSCSVFIGSGIAACLARMHVQRVGDHTKSVSLFVAEGGRHTGGGA